MTSQSSEASHATTGELLAGSIASNASSLSAIISGNAPSVIRVRATGAIALTLTP